MIKKGSIVRVISPSHSCYNFYGIVVGEDDNLFWVRLFQIHDDKFIMHYNKWFTNMKLEKVL